MATLVFRLIASIGVALTVVAFASVAFAEPPAPGPVTQTYGGRDLLVYVPTRLPPRGARALVIVLHGAFGNARRIESGGSEPGLGMDAVAERDGFIVAYLNGTPIGRFLNPNALGWNAGSCCGVPAEDRIDDVAYVTGAATFLSDEYGIDRNRIFGIGHSNGAMMTLRVLCEAGLYAAAVPISGPLDTTNDSCPAARGKRILAIHGADDQNVPIAGGHGAGFALTVFGSEERSRNAFVNAGATYDLQVVPAADHALGNIDAAIHAAEGQSIADKAARFFGLETR
jgi:polyhydroxybutyrate depolymerase